jgi:hypothetical protein
VLELHRPAGPLPVLAREARNVPADDNQCGKNGSASSGVAVDKITEALLGSNIAEHNAVEELALEGFCDSQHGGSFRGQHRPTLLRACSHPVPPEQDSAGEQAHAELHEDGREQEHVDQESSLQQREQRPLVVIVLVVGTRPRTLEVAQETRDFGVEAANVLRHGSPEPVRIATVGDFEGSNLGKEPGKNQGDGCGHNQTRWSAESRFTQSRQCGGNIAGFCLSKWFNRAHVTCEESEHGHSDASLPW